MYHNLQSFSSTFKLLLHIVAKILHSNGSTKQKVFVLFDFFIYSQSTQGNQKENRYALKLVFAKCHSRLLLSILTKYLIEKLNIGIAQYFFLRNIKMISLFPIIMIIRRLNAKFTICTEKEDNWVQKHTQVRRLVIYLIQINRSLQA